MKKRTIQKLWALGLSLVMVIGLTACGGGSAETTTTDTAETTEATETTDTAEAAPADNFDPSQYSVAICMDNMNHPVHRIVQLGFLKAAAALGYDNAKVIGT